MSVIATFAIAIAGIFFSIATFHVMPCIITVRVPVSCSMLIFIFNCCQSRFTALLAPLSFAADIVYLLDSSDDVTQENYGHEKDFVIYLARYLNTMPTRSRGAVVTYGSTPAVVSKFNEARRTQGFEMRLHGAPKQGGQRRMDLALDAASRMLTKTRPAIPKVVILLTAGKQTAGIDAGVLEESVQRVQNLGARVYVVTVNASHVTLPIKSSTGSNWFPVKSFAYLPILVVPMARHVVSDTGLSS